jgi:lauroyl/myristoyl acyltransferase
VKPSVKRAIPLYLITWLGCAVLLFLALRPKNTAREVIVTSAIAAATLLIVGVRLYDLILAIRKPAHTREERERIGRKKREERRKAREERSKR